MCLLTDVYLQLRDRRCPCPLNPDAAWSTGLGSFRKTLSEDSPSMTLFSRKGDRAHENAEIPSPQIVNSFGLRI